MTGFGGVVESACKCYSEFRVKYASFTKLWAWTEGVSMSYGKTYPQQYITCNIVKLVSSMCDRIHVDDKWFFLTREKERYLLHWDEKNPKHCVKHKLHITKVMFLCAVARPHFNTCSNSWWDGKLGIWPIGDWEPVKRKLKNMPKGMPVWKNKIITKEVYHDLLITKLILSILEKWPRRDWLSRKILFNKMEQKITLVATTSYSTMRWWRKASTQHSILKHQTHLMSTYWI